MKIVRIPFVLKKDCYLTQIIYRKKKTVEQNDKVEDKFAIKTKCIRYQLPVLK